MIVVMTATIYYTYSSTNSDHLAYSRLYIISRSAGELHSELHTAITIPERIIRFLQKGLRSLDAFLIHRNKEKCPGLSS